MKGIVPVFGCCDNNPSKWGSEFHEFPVISPKELERMIQEEPDNVLIQLAVASEHQGAVSVQLEGMGAKHIASWDLGAFTLEGACSGTVSDLIPSFCCGCSACASICPNQAITLEPDKEGYLKPNIHPQTCTHCGLCRSVCPVIHPPQDNEADASCYALMADDEIRLESSSGGAFSLLASEILTQGGAVCGVILNDDFQVLHTIIDKLEDLPPMRGSKYVQSHMGDTFSHVKQLLNAEKTVLFTGTPCQVAGLKNYLGKPMERLYTVDLVCHGAPSASVFSKYLSDYYGIENLEKFVFRNKKFGYNSFHQIASMKDGSEKVGFIKYDAFEKIMHSGVSLHDICKYCFFAPTPRQGDLSIGDFWGIAKYDPALQDNKGTSVVLVNNHKGKKLLEKIAGRTKLLQTVPLDFALKNNRFGPYLKTPSGKKELYQAMEHHHINKATEYALNRKYDIGVVGLWYGRNYGSMITYYALNYVLTGMGLSVLMIKNINKPQKRPGTIRSHVEMVSDEFYHVSQQYTKETLPEVNAHCDAFLLGSDQLWNIHLSRDQGQTFFLGFADDSKKKIAYATSAGGSYKGNPEERNISAHHLQRFDHISVRDEMSEKICKEEFGVDSVRTCDPTLLCGKEVYQELAKKSQRHEEGAYILAYVLNPSPEFGELLENLGKETGKKVIVVLDEPPMKWEENRKKLNLSPDSPVIVKELVNLYQWLWYYEHAESVVTDSFHGSIFSIIFQKPFLTKINRQRGGERFIALFKELDVSYRLFEDLPDLQAQFSLLEAMDYSKVNQRVEDMVDFSKKWLEHAVFSGKVTPSHRVFDNIAEKATV